MFKQLFQKNVSTHSQPPVSSPSANENPKPFAGWLGKMFSNLSSQADDFTFEEEDFENLEDALIKSDFGVDLAVSLVEKLQKQGLKKQQAVIQTLKTELSGILNQVKASHQIKYQAGVLNLYFVVGINGGGKTTTIGKLAHRFKQQNKTVLVAAADTFRAAAVEQLAVWAQRASVGFISLEKGNPAAVVYEAIERAIEQKADVLIIDTAGRLQNKFNLMEELKNLNDILKKKLPANANVEKLLVLDASIGQNAQQQAELFNEVTDLDGLILTKVDGSGKGGVIFSIAEKYQLPVKLMGCGEKITDLIDFVPNQFIETLFEDIGV